MTAQVCCVDHTRPGTKVIAGRWFCDEHFDKATHKRPGVWRSDLFAVIGLLVFVAAVVVLDAWLQPEFTRLGLLLVGVVLAVVPAAFWLAFFYLQDRLEPEPVGHVARMFVIGLALAGAIGIPITDELFRVQDWLYLDSSAGVGLTEVLGSIFVSGAVEAFLVFATVRYFIFDSPEFDERTDGVIYTTAAALGYATALNLQFILANQGAALGAGEIFVAEVALARAAFGGLLGYFLGRAKLEQEPLWWLPAGLLLTALLNGSFNLLRGQLDPGTIVKGAGAGLPSFTGLLLAGGLAALVTALVAYLINRDIARSLTGTQPEATEDPTVGDRQANYAAIATFAALLIVGIFTWNNAVNRTVAFDRDGFRGAYPASYGDTTEAGEVLRVADTLGSGAQFVITTWDLGAGGNARTIASELAGERSTDYALYKAESSDVIVQGRSALKLEFTYVTPGGLTGALPEVRQGMDYIFADGDQGVVVTLLTTPEQLAEVEPLFNRFLNGLTMP